MSTYTDRLQRTAPKSFIQKSFKDMTKNEFAALKKAAIFGIGNFRKEPAFTRKEFLQEDLWVDNITLKRNKSDAENIILNYFKSNEEIRNLIAWQLEAERDARKEAERKLPEWQRNLSWEKLIQSKLFTNKI